MPLNETEYGKGRDILVRANGVKKIYGEEPNQTFALRGVDLVIYKGEYLCVMGPSGSGKSTFFNMLGGLDSPTNGRVFMDEVNMAQLNAHELAFLRCRKIGYVFQAYNLNQTMTALENVTLPMIFSGMHPDDARAKGINLLEKVGLGSRWSHRPKAMSGGQQQRVAIARSLANNPQLLLCDEPTANLDHKTGKEVHKILFDLNKKEGVTIICATHDHDMLKVSDRMIWIEDGKIARIDRSSDIEIKSATMGKKEHE